MMDWLWVVWLIVTGVLFFSFEGYALLHPEQMHTLSYWLWFIVVRYPAICMLGCAGIIAALSIHFWHYSP
jgi:hypothetical protein